MRQAPSNIDIPEQERACTGIPGLDQFLGGGLPAHRLYRVEGTPGSGKTNLGLPFLRRGAEDGEKGLYTVEVFELLTDEGLSPPHKGRLPLLGEPEERAG